MNFKYALTIESGFRLKNIILDKFLYGILIGTGDHQVCFVWRKELSRLSHATTTHGGNELS